VGEVWWVGSRLLRPCELATFGFDEPGLSALDLHLSQDGGVQRGVGRQAVGAGPVPLPSHHLNQLNTVHRLARLFQDASGGVQGADLLSLGFLGLRLALRLGFAFRWCCGHCRLGVAFDRCGLLVCGLGLGGGCRSRAFRGCYVIIFPAYGTWTGIMQAICRLSFPTGQHLIATWFIFSPKSSRNPQDLSRYV
jgi:hypothetical protein